MDLKKLRFWIKKEKLLSLEVCSFLFYFLTQFPGRAGADANSAIGMMRDGTSKAYWTKQYFSFLQILTFDGHYLALATGIGYASLIFALHFLVRNLWKPFSSVKTLVYASLIASPLVGVYGMTLDHNLQSTTGAIILFGLVFKHLNGEAYLRRHYFIAAAAVGYCCMAYIGFVSLFGFLLCGIFLRVKRKLLVTSSMFATLFILMSSLLPVESSGPGFKLIPLLEDVRCLVANKDVVISRGDLDFLAKLGPISSWQSPVSCITPDSGDFARLKITNSNQVEFLKVWIRLFENNPRYILIAHLQRASVALPPGISLPQPNPYSLDPKTPLGINAPRGMHTWVGVLDDSRYQTNAIQKQPNFLKVFQYVVIFPTIILNYASYIWGWGGLWLLVITITLYRSWKIRGLLISLPVVLVHAFLFFMIPVPDPRYVYISILLGIVMLTLKPNTITSSSRKPTPR